MATILYQLLFFSSAVYETNVHYESKARPRAIPYKTPKSVAQFTVSTALSCYEIYEYEQSLITKDYTFSHFNSSSSSVSRLLFVTSNWLCSDVVMRTDLIRNFAGSNVISIFPASSRDADGQQFRWNFIGK